MNRKARRAARGFVPTAQAGLDGLATTYFQEGNRLAQQGRLAEAVALYRRTIAARPDHAAALSNLGNALMMLGQSEEAIAAWRGAIAADPEYALPHANLGSALSQQGRLDEALEHLRRATALKPDFVDALDHLARTLLAAGQASQALHVTRRAIAIKPTSETKKIFVDCLRHVAFTSDEPQLRAILVEAVTEPWARPDRLIGPASTMARRNPVIAACVDPATRGWPARLDADALWPGGRRAAVCADPLLRLLLVTAPICNLDLERFLTNARAVLLSQAQTATGTADESTLAFWCALAQQCFINEYIFAFEDAERDAADHRRQALEAALAGGHDVPPDWLAAVGSYHPLHSLPRAASLLARSWPPAAQALLAQQVQEPLEEARDRAAIPALTAIDDTVSLSVRDQYMKNIPIRAGSRCRHRALLRPSTSTCAAYCPGGALRPTTAAAATSWSPAAAPVTIRSTWRSARGMRASLRSTSASQAWPMPDERRALGVTNIEYAQADILRAASIGRTFDVIESGGVLHHLDDPMAGWRALLTLLRPGGLMFLGLYSEQGRQGVVAGRDFITARGYRQTADDIRRFRQDVASAPDAPVGKLLRSPDFFSVSGCRDLFFHACEHRMSLPQIDSFLRENELTFLGFHLESQWLQKFRRRHPDEAALTDLALWHEFETEHPPAFGAMYHFWLQKAA
jgi:tetratricopeptide (TPR) repeat protein/SAM-dependent methyltransferase